MRGFNPRAYPVPGLVLACSLCSGPATGAGFQLFELGVKGQGLAHAGMSTRADGPETVYFNPAGMSLLRGAQVSLGLTQHFVEAEFDGQGSYGPAAGPLAGSRFENSAAGANGRDLFLPAAGLYGTTRVSERVSLGLAVNTPFGLRTDYGNAWAGRYLADESELLTIHVNPSLAFAVNDALTIGAGVSATYARARLTQAVDYGLLLAPLGQVPGARINDGRAVIDGDDWGFGYNVGILYEPAPGTRLGLAYRSRQRLDLEGTGYFDTGRFPAALLGPAFADGRASATLDLPQWLTFGAYHEFAPNWAGMVEMTWTDWSVIDELRIRSPGNAARPDVVLPTNWNDSWRIAVGVVHEPTPALTLRAGIAHEQTPVPGPSSYAPRIPAGDGTSVALGASISWTPRLTLDIAYTHIFVDALPIDRIEGPHRLAGDYEGSVDIVGIQLHYATD